MAGKQIICCYRSCDRKDDVEDRIEVKTVFPQITSSLRKKFLIDWHANGEAEFHVGCWEKVYEISKSRKKKNVICMTKEEKVMVDIAAKAPEQFDCVSKILDQARKAALWVKNSKHCVAFTGAGISTAAGIGDFRGKAGKWTEEDQNSALLGASTFDSSSDDDDIEPPTKKLKQEVDTSIEEEEESDDGVPYEKLRPTYTHEALHKLMSDGYLKYIISQNGDGLHGLAGIHEDNIAELHGNVFMEICESCGHRYVRDHYVLDDVGSQYYEELEDFGRASVRKPKYAVKCQLCGLSHRTGRKCEVKGCKGYLKDTIINFRDFLDEDVLQEAESQSKSCDVMLCLGTTLQVTPASNLVRKMKSKDRLIICNRQETALDGILINKGRNDSTKGCRVFGDCDIFIKEVMKHIYPSDELETWESQRAERMKVYDSKRE